MKNELREEKKKEDVRRTMRNACCVNEHDNGKKMGQYCAQTCNVCETDQLKAKRRLVNVSRLRMMEKIVFFRSSYKKKLLKLNRKKGRAANVGKNDDNVFASKVKR